MEKSKHLGIRVEEDLHKKLTYIAKYEGRSVNGQIIYMIKKLIRDFEKENGEIK